MGAMEKESPASTLGGVGRADSDAHAHAGRVVARRQGACVYEDTPGAEKRQGGPGGSGGRLDPNGNFVPGFLVVHKAGQRVGRMERAIRAFSVEVMGCRGALMLTLTFRDGSREQALGAIRRFLKAFRKVYGRFKVFWWAELQRRGAVHYHVLVVDAPFIPDRGLASLWPHGYVAARWFDGHRGFSYALKYARKLRKAYQQDYVLFSVLYKGFRVYSHTRLTDTVARAFKLPAWLREWVWHFGELPRRVPGGWEFPSSGQVVTTPWRFDGADGEFVWLRWVGSVVLSRP